MRFRAMTEVNLFGQLAVIQGFAHLLISTSNNKRLGATKGLILNIGSTAALGNPWNGAYGTTKVSHNISQVTSENLFSGCIPCFV